MSHHVETTPAPATGWTLERKVHFLDRLSVHGNARAACRAVGLSAEAAYKLRRRDAQFARGWAAALVLARENGLQVLGERAIEGIDEEIYYRGELIGTRRRYDSRLLLAHLARLDQLADEETAGVDAGRFDELIACIAEGDGDELPPARDAYVEEAATIAEQEQRAEQRKEFPILFDEHLGDLSPEEDEELARLDTICCEAADRAADEARVLWDRHLRDTFSFVDAICNASPAPVAPGRSNSFSHLAAADPIPATMIGQANSGWSSIPCTLSTASTTALARALADAPPNWQTPPRSPFTAPRQLEQ